MKHIRHLAGAAAAVVAIALSSPASADDLVKMTIGQRGNWDTAVPHLGEKAGIFKKHGITMEMVYTCLLYTSPSPRDGLLSRMPSSA